MPYVDPEFVVPTVPADEQYEGTEIDDNLRADIVTRAHFSVDTYGVFSITCG